MVQTFSTAFFMTVGTVQKKHNESLNKPTFDKVGIDVVAAGDAGVVGQHDPAVVERQDILIKQNHHWLQKDLNERN